MFKLPRILACLLGVVCIVLEVIYDPILKQYVPAWTEGTPGWVVLFASLTVLFLGIEIYYKLADRRRKAAARQGQPDNN